MKIVRNLAAYMIAGILCQGTLFSADLTWDANTGSTDAQDGSGTWGSDNWWNGAANVTWNNGTPDNATIGVGGTGGTITLGTAEAGYVSFSSFDGTYTLVSGSLLINDGAIIGPKTDNQTVVISGATITNQGTLYIGSNDYASAANNTLTLENGARLLGGGNVVIGHKPSPGAGSYNVGGAGAPSYASNGVLYVAYNSRNEKVTVSNGFLTVSSLSIGYSPGGNARSVYGCSVTVDNQGSLEVRGSGMINIGHHNNYQARSDRNTLLVKNGGTVTAGGDLRVGARSQQAYNNQAIIRDGGRLTTGGAVIGERGSSNSVHVIGSATGNSSWDLSGGTISFKNAYGVLEVDGAGIAGSAIVTNIGSMSVSADNTLMLGSAGRVYANSVSVPGEIAINLDDSVNSDVGQLMVSGSLNLSGATLDISGKKRGTFIIAEYTSLTGTFAATNGTLIGDKVEYNYLGRNQVVLVARARGTVLTLH